MGMIHCLKVYKHIYVLNLPRHCIFADNFQTFHHIVEFESFQNVCLLFWFDNPRQETIKKLLEVDVSTDIRNLYFTRKIKKLDNKF